MLDLAMLLAVPAANRGTVPPTRFTTLVTEAEVVVVVEDVEWTAPGRSSLSIALARSGLDLFIVGRCGTFDAGPTTSFALRCMRKRCRACATRPADVVPLGTAEDAWLLVVVGVTRRLV